MRLYQRAFAGKPPTCRYLPTCSEYAVQALERRGPVTGLLLTAWRLLRCHPFARMRVDEVPLKPR